MKKYLFLILVFSISTIYSQSVTEKANVYLKNNDLNRAKLLLQRQVSNNSSDLSSIELLGDIYSFEKKWDEAMELYKILVQNDSENAAYNFKYGGAIGMKALSVSKLQAAVYIPDIKKYLEKAASLDRSQIESRRALVELYVKLPGFLGGSNEKAIFYADQLKKLSTVNAYLAKGFIVKENESVEEALFYYRNAFKNYKTSSNSIASNSLNYELGKVAAELNLESDYGLKLLDTYVKKYSYKDIYSMEWVYLRKAQIMANLKNKSEALSFIDKALTLRGDFKEALDEKERIEEL
tara:strand:- start:26932 stop:27813 length:882 start_codon:yes stop_codon:yes gene_type:complete